MGQEVANTTRDRLGRITGSRGLTAQQTAFVNTLVRNGGHATAAAEAAGYSDAHSAAWHLQQLPHVQAAIHAARQKKLSNLATAGLDLLESVIRGTLDGVKPKDRLDASKFVIQLAGHVAPKAPEGESPDDKPLEEMTIEELEAFVRRGEAAVKLARQPVLDHVSVAPTAPEVAPDGSQAIDITPKDPA